MAKAKVERKTRKHPIGLALAGGAAGGAIYEIGAVHALDETIVGLDLNDLDVYVGVSAGAFLTACLANGLSTRQMCRAIVKPEPGEHPFVPEMFFQPALGEISSRLARTPGLVAQALGGYFSRRERRLRDALTILGRALPVALFKSEPIREYVHKIFAIKDRTDDFRQLARQLFIVATDLESGEAVRFGEPGFDHVPISRAVQASSALPGLYPPVEIDSRRYVDGILLKTMHASAALESGAELLICINPIVPVDARKGIQTNELRPGQIVDRGLPAVLSQTVRTIIHSRMELGLKAYDTRFPNADVLLVEPPRDDYESFFSNIFTFAQRRKVCERAYQATRKSLLDRRETLEPILERHGLALDIAVLEDQDRNLWDHVQPRTGPAAEPAQATSGDAIDDLDRILARARRMVDA